MVSVKSVMLALMVTPGVSPSLVQSPHSVRRQASARHHITQCSHVVIDTT